MTWNWKWIFFSISFKYSYFKPIFNYIRKWLYKGILICWNCDTLVCFPPLSFPYQIHNRIHVTIPPIIYKKTNVEEVNSSSSIAISKKKVGKCIEKPITKRMMLFNSPVNKQKRCEFQELTQVVIHEEAIGTLPYLSSLIFIL